MRDFSRITENDEYLKYLNTKRQEEIGEYLDGAVLKNLRL